jgi:hypothetical protein
MDSPPLSIGLSWSQGFPSSDDSGLLLMSGFSGSSISSEDSAPSNLTMEVHLFASKISVNNSKVLETFLLAELYTLKCMLIQFLNFLSERRLTLTYVFINKFYSFLHPQDEVEFVKEVRYIDIVT